VRSTAALALALIVPASVAMAQPSAVLFRGRVVDAANDRPLRRAIVSVWQPSDDRTRPVLTDEDGRFVIELPEPTSAIVITKAGYASTVIERDRRTPRDLEVRLARGAVMSGRVVEQGLPAIGARVVARPLEDTSATAPTYQAETDDLGEYRIGGLPAGRYTVASNPPQQVLRIVQALDPSREAVQGIVLRRRPLFPGITTPGMPGPTRVVEVRSGQETSDVDFEVPLSRLPSAQVVGSAAAAAEFFKRTDDNPGAIKGRVVMPTGQPVSGAMVSISGNNQIRTVTADEEGRFDLGRFRDGDYSIEAGKSGYLMPDFRSLLESQTALMVRVSDDLRAHDVEVVLARGGAIAGTIVDGAGEPFQGVLVRAVRLRQNGGRMVGASTGWPRLTDDRGRYRLFGLPPGSYLIVATLNATETSLDGIRASGFAPVYYPGTASIESAQNAQVVLGSAVSGVDLTFAVTSTTRVTGKALNTAGEPLHGRVALAISARSGSVAAEPRYALLDSDGSFALANVPPGDYVVQALGEPGPGVPREFGAEYITVAEHDPPALTIRTAVGAVLDGRFVGEGRSSLPMRAQVIHAAPLDADRSPAGGRGPDGLAVHEDGRFYLTGLFGSMRFTYPAPAGWYLKSVTIGGVDVTDRPFDFGFGEEIFPDAEIVLSNAGARIAGSVMDASDRRSPEFVVVAFSANRANWFPGSRHIMRASTGPNGSFDIDAVPPGEYYVVAIDALPPDEWQSPDALGVLIQRGERVTVGEGQTRTLTLRLNRR
jgi:carboxypeptidase family protein